MIPYVRDIQFDYGVCDQVSPLIRRVVARNPGPFTFMGTGTYIVGRGEVAVIDPGPDLAEHLEAILAALEPDERVTHILVTHHHSDHSPLARPLKEKTGATIYGCAVGAAAEESTIRTEAGADFDFAPDVSLCGGGQVLEGPGWTLEAVATPGHTSNHICFALKEENALFSGDHIMGWSTTVITPPDGDMTDYMESLERVKARDFDVLWPTHGPPILEVTPFIEAYAAHRRAREAQVLAAVGDGYERIVDMVPVLYAAVDSRLHPAAARSVLGHMIDLVRRGKVATDGPPSIDSRYRLAT
ncbi:MBL fold metallo-hydrolase [Phenylobacterium sp.]|uniref:MBL fold metallo-hydrolase n=1 Tax=Phenylobacterium sp. TaxID=1871053 RepID=UPI002731CB7C|nr:MBL fold metallo-hydrolase [Phenylobacterium sp.]MDP1874519.1 MBL fold metallo-hydrolase [Phenylobacterium sp.]MDP3488770.1 MBL fold metallo-hydrolase [Phenylobacterium sp.]